MSISDRVSIITFFLISTITILFVISLVVGKIGIIIGVGIFTSAAAVILGRFIGDILLAERNPT